MLAVDDEPHVVDGLRKALHPFRASWTLETATSGEEALKRLEGGGFDALITDARMPGMDGEALLKAVIERWPGLLRVVLSGEVTHGTFERLHLLAHQMVAKPVDAASLYWRIDEALLARERLITPGLQALVLRSSALPSLPPTFAAVQRLSATAEATLTQFVDAVEADGAVCATVLKVVNSAWFGLSSRVSSLREAVRMLGVRMLCDVVLAAQVFGGNGPVLERLRRDAVQRLRAVPPGSSDVASTAAVLMDVGQLVLLLHAPETFLIIERAVEEGAERHAEERRHFGASSAVVGAALIESWGLPGELVDALCPREEDGGYLPRAS